MKRVKVLLRFLRLSVLEKIGFYRNVIEKMTGNASFPNPDVTLESCTAAVNSLEAAYLAALDGSKLAKSVMRDAEEACDELFRKLAGYVNRIADGSETIILSSGFQITKQPNPALRPEFTVEHGALSSVVKLSRKAVDVARSYVWQYSRDLLPESDADWSNHHYSTKSSTEISGLVVGSKYWFRSAAISTEGLVEFTDPVMLIVV